MIKTLNHFRLFVFVICALFLPVTTRSQTKTIDLTAINSRVADIDRFIKANKKSRIFGDVSSGMSADEPSRWKEFKSDAEMEEANPYESALVWTRQGKVVGANFTFSSPSGDWAHFVMYYFREDGSLAKIDAQLNTFYGDLSIIRQQYYNSQGKLIKSTRKYLDLDTQKPKKPTGDFFDNKFPVYRSVTALPFQKLL